MITKKISKINCNNQKPIEYDIHLKYICKQCGQIHWLSLREASTKRFKIVCDCGLTFGVKRVKDFKLIYHKKIKDIKPQQESKVVVEEAPKPIPVIPNNLLDQSIKILVGYGFTKTEAKLIITKSYENSPVDNVPGLIKQTLESLRENNTNVK